MISRRAFLTAVGASLVFPFASLAQTQKRVRSVGILSSRKRPPSLENDTLHGEVPRRLRELGWVEGENLGVEWRFAAGDYARMPNLAAELVRLSVDVIVTNGSEGIQAAQGATKTIPIVFMGGSDLVAQGFVKSLAHPGGNTTGVSLLAPDIAGKQVEILMRFVPKLTRLAVLFNPANPAHRILLEATKAGADAFRVQTIPVGASTPSAIDEAFSVAVKERAEAIVFTQEAFLQEQSKRIANLALAHHLPSISPAFEYPDAGGLMCYGPNRTQLFRRVAEYVDKILKGANPGDLPVEQPTKFDVVINRKTARALGLTIPPELLVQADRVIE